MVGLDLRVHTNTLIVYCIPTNSNSQSVIIYYAKIYYMQYISDSDLSFDPKFLVGYAMRASEPFEPSSICEQVSH